MMMSARILGEKLGLTGQEMNYALKAAGFLNGTPGDYDITEKAKPFVVEQDFHRGNGGYAIYNKYFTTRKWNEDILGKLNLDNEHKAEIRNAVANDRRLKKEASLVAQQVFTPCVTDVIEKDECEVSKLETKDLVKIGGVIIAVTATGYVIYKVAPRVKRWWKTKVMPRIKKEKHH